MRLIMDTTVRTPEGETCGLSKNLALTALVSSRRDEVEATWGWAIPEVSHKILARMEAASPRRVDQLTRGAALVDTKQAKSASETC